jgi:hypothetical protein
MVNPQEIPMRHLAAFAVAVLIAAPASATSFTTVFTDLVWAGANPIIQLPPISTPTFTVVDSVGSGVDVTATVLMGTGALGAGPSLINDVGTQTTGNLPNGLGVTLGIDSSEIDRVEKLRISFSTPVVIDSFLASRFFMAGVSGDIANELGNYQLENGGVIQFEANASDPAEGRQSFLVGGGPVSFIDFFAPGPADNDYSLVSLTFTVPEPGILALLGCAGLFVVGRRRVA